MSALERAERLKPLEIPFQPFQPVAGRVVLTCLRNGRARAAPVRHQGSSGHCLKIVGTSAAGKRLQPFGRWSFPRLCFLRTTLSLPVAPATMANLFRSFGRTQRSAVSTLFALTFLGSFAIVAVPCPAATRRLVSLEDEAASRPAEVELSRQERAERARRKFGFLEEGKR